MTPFAMSDLFTGKLVKLAAKDAEYNEAAARWSNDAEYMRLFMFESAVPRPVAYFENDKERNNSSHNRFDFALRTIAENKIIGFTGLGPMWNHQSAWMWIAIGDADYRGKGYGTDAIKLIVGYGFRELNLYRISLGVFGNNPRAIRAYEKAGFVHEGVTRSVIYRDGQRYDSLVMGILRPDWEAAISAQS